MTKQTVTTVSKTVMHCVECLANDTLEFCRQCQECFKSIADILACCSRKSGYLKSLFTSYSNNCVILNVSVAMTVSQ